MTDLLNQAGSDSTVSHFAGMSYDGAGNRLSVTASGASSYNGTTSYTYDYGQTANPALSRSQVTQESSTRVSYTNTFSYDGGTSTGPGNPTSFKGTAQTFNADNQQTGTGYGYDGAGNPTLYQGKALTFDPENRMTGYAGTTQTDGYEGDGLRAWKQNSTATTYFLYDGEQAVAEYAVAGSPPAATLVATNTYGADGLVSRRNVSTSATTFYAFDERGNVAQRLGSMGTLISSDVYDAYGTRTGTAAQAGCYVDMEAGLVLCTYRFCDSSSGRWLTRNLQAEFLVAV